MDIELHKVIELTYAVAMNTKPAAQLRDALCRFFNSSPTQYDSYAATPTTTDPKGSLYQAEHLLITSRPASLDNNDHWDDDSNASSDYIIAILLREPSDKEFTTWLEMQYPPRESRKEDWATLQGLASHFDQALTIRFQLQHQLASDRALVDKLLNLAPFSIIMFDQNAQPCKTNLGINNALSGDGLILSADGVKAEKSGENRRLQHLINDACRAPSPLRDELAYQDILITRPSGKRPYCITLTHLNTSETSNDGEPVIIVMIHDPEAGMQIPHQRLQSAFTLTKTEARVAAAIIQGQSLQECADSIGHSVSTSRNLLKRVFAKTDTCKQSQLNSLFPHTTIN
ncbi:hypothetical protein A9Q89_04830 [Gammaproteobacteria bacterium 53_120_T64]|nr:hypothetical protein A9Q89_04830 [Gammaproteobacteria bacterium 53_120_T64]